MSPGPRDGRMRLHGSGTGRTCGAGGDVRRRLRHARRDRTRPHVRGPAPLLGARHRLPRARGSRLVVRRPRARPLARHGPRRRHPGRAAQRLRRRPIRPRNRRGHGHRDRRRSGRGADGPHGGHGSHGGHGPLGRERRGDRHGPRLRHGPHGLDGPHGSHGPHEPHGPRHGGDVLDGNARRARPRRPCLRDVAGPRRTRRLPGPARGRGPAAHRAAPLLTAPLPPRAAACAPTGA